MNRSHPIDLVNVAAREAQVEAIVDSLQGKPSADAAARFWTEPMAAIGGNVVPRFMKCEVGIED